MKPVTFTKYTILTTYNNVIVTGDYCTVCNSPQPGIMCAEIVDSGVVDQPLGDGLDQLDLAMVATVQTVQI